MKLATFRVMTSVGPFDRLGLVRLEGGRAETVADARAGRGHVVDANFVYAAMAADRGHADGIARADAFCPSDLTRFAALYGTSLEVLEEILSWAAERIEDASAQGPAGPRGERLAYRLDEVSLMPPVARVPVLRDFAAFEDHLKVTFAKMGLSIPAVWYERPTAFKGNPTTIVGHDQEAPWPSYGRKLDYELELAAVIGRPGRDIDFDQASSHILGYTLLNDFSARDVQAGEMAMSTGPYKGKDFAWGLGPWIVTPDELGDPAEVAMKVSVNGEVWAESTPGPMQWTFAEIVAYTSQCEALNIGDVFGSGTVNSGCGFEIDRWIAPGDVVELEAAGLGVLRHRMGRPDERQVRWRRPGR